jgi:hypothetical protein
MCRIPLKGKVFSAFSQAVIDPLFRGVQWGLIPLPMYLGESLEPNVHTRIPARSGRDQSGSPGGPEMALKYLPTKWSFVILVWGYLRIEDGTSSNTGEIGTPVACQGGVGPSGRFLLEGP